MGWVLAIVWVIWAAAAMVTWWAVTLPPVPATVPPDPYAAEVARFRRQVHDWDRDGRMD